MTVLFASTASGTCVTMADLLYKLARPALFYLDPERAHRISIWALRLGLGGLLGGRARGADDPILATKVWGLAFPNPIGLAAGYDKDAEVCDGALRLGFGFVEAGTVTPQPQPGNSGQRLFRLTGDEAVINRFGFNSRGLAPFVERLARRRARPGIVGANVGKNRDAPDAAADYVAGIADVGALADYLVINISSPNTPGLRALQAHGEIEDLLGRVQDFRRSQAGRRPPLLVKVGPDLEEGEMRDIAAAVLAAGVDGLIIGNTTVTRPATLKSADRNAQGGLSGRPLFALSTACLAAMYRFTEGRIPIIGCGGVASGADAYTKICAGASLVQLYSALVYQGPGLVGRIKTELTELLRRDGFKSVADAVGTGTGPGQGFTPPDTCSRPR
jgi:dihydroorotate dehydrogenase